jgi:hypothetical protein
MLAARRYGPCYTEHNMRIAPRLTLATALPVCVPHALAEAGANTTDAPTRVAHARSSATDTAQRLVALLYLRRDEITNTMRGELHPLAFAHNGEFRDATWPSVEDDADESSTISMLPATARQFAIYEADPRVDRYRVWGVSAGQRSLAGDAPFR